MAGGVQRSTERALGGNASLQELAQVAVLHVLEHGTQRTLVLAAADSQQADDVGVLQTSRRPRVLVKLRPIRTTAAGGGAAVELEVSARRSATLPGRPLCAGGVYGRSSPVSLCSLSLRGPPGALHSDVYWPAQPLLRMVPGPGTDYQRPSDHQNCRSLHSSASSRPTCSCTVSCIQSSGAVVTAQIWSVGVEFNAPLDTI